MKNKLDSIPTRRKHHHRSVRYKSAKLECSVNDTTEALKNILDQRLSLNDDI